MQLTSCITMCKHCITNSLPEKYLKDLPPVFSAAMKELWNKNLRPQDLSPELLKLIAQELWLGAGIGFEEAKVTPSVELAAELEKNIYVFSGFKTYQQLHEASLMLTDGDGNLRPFTKFLQDAKALNKTYNVTYLEAEYNNSIASAQMASKWEEFEANKSVAKFLKYQTAHDDRVRPAHAMMDGVVREVGDPFWNTYYPPLGWSCRCNVISMVEGVISSEVEKPEIPEMFKNNVGKTGVIFPDTHPYYDAPEQIKKRVLNNSLQIYKNK